MLSRALFDQSMVFISYAIAYLVKFTWAIGFEAEHFLAHPFFLKLSRDFASTFLIINLISLVVFSMSGFYTRGRAYQSRFKAVVVFQAVSVSYLIFATCLYFFPSLVSNQRSVIFIAWVLTLCSVGLSRLWRVLWCKLEGVAILNVTKSDPKSILVIGGGGYIGSALLPMLLNENYKVRLLDSFVYGEEPIKAYIHHPNLQIIKADFRQIGEIVKAVKGVSSVVHLGAIVGDPACALDEDLTVEVNLIATKLIAEVCKGNHIKRFIFASTCSVYGASDEVLNEQSKLNPVSLYAKTKIACEKVLLNMADHGFAPTILRFSTIFGISGRTRFDLVVNLLTAKAKFDKKITLYGGDQWRPFLHVEDAALSVMSVLKAPESNVANQVFNVGDSDNNYTLESVGKMIQERIPDAELLEMGQDGDRRNYRVDFSKIQKYLGYKSKWSVAAGVEQVIEAIDSGKVTSYSDAKFSNLKFMQESGQEHLTKMQFSKVADLLHEA